MHELSVCRALVGQVTEIARQHRTSSVARVWLRIGPLSGVEPALLESAYLLASCGTPAENAALLIEIPPVRVRCLNCGAESEAAPNRLVCACCGDCRTQLLSGDEMMLASVDLIS